MKVIVAEKAIAGRRIAAILAGKDVPLSSVEKAQAFSFKKDGVDFVVLPLRGHIVDVDFPKQYSYWLGTDLRNLVKAEIEYIGKEKIIISGLKKIAKECDEVIIATDADREGEAIGVEALNFIKESNPKIKISRAYFSAIIKEDIEKAFKKLSKVDYNFADSADTRREIDLIWGAIITRFLSLVSGRLGKEFLSAGRVQTPVLALIIQKEKERLAFKTKKYWELKALFEKDKQQFEAEHKNGRFWEKKEAENALAKKSEKGIVSKVEKKKRTLKKPTPFNTTSFLRAATNLGFSAGEAMNVGESLYQAGYCSYPRTDNQKYPANLDLRKVLNELIKSNEFAGDVEKILALKKLEPSQGKQTKDHPPIYPVSVASKEKLSPRQWKIYELVAKRFLATLSEDAVTENLTVEIDLNSEPYIARGQLLIKPGWKAVYPYSVLKEVMLPELQKGDEVKLIDLELLEKETQPPARYSQGSLIKLMSELGLGTKSTRAEIIQKLYSRQYISGLKSIEPNKIAFAVIDSLEKHAEQVAKPEMTAQLEKEMDLIAVGKKEKQIVVTESRNFLSELLKDLLEHKNEIGSEIRRAVQADALMFKCDKCDGQLRKIKSRNNKWFLGCNNYPKCTNTYPLPQQGKIIASEKICPVCSKPMIKVIGKRYRYEMCIDHNCDSKKDWKKKTEEKLNQKKKAEENKQEEEKLNHKKATEEKAVKKEENK